MADQDEILRQLSAVREEQQTQKQLLEDMQKRLKNTKTMGRIRFTVYAVIMLFTFISVYIYYKTIVDMFSI